MIQLQDNGEAQKGPLMAEVENQSIAMVVGADTTAECALCRRMMFLR